MLVPARLIQRGEIKALPKGTYCPLNKAVYLDYMGSAQFGPWSLPKSLRAIQDNADRWRFRTPNILNEGTRLSVFSFLSDEDFKTYFSDLLNMRIGKQQTEERTHFAICRAEDKRTTDFWWDIENHVMWSFNEDFMLALPEHLKCSFKELDEARSKARTGG